MPDVDTPSDLLECVRITAQRVQRFAADVEADPDSVLARAVWRASLEDLQDALRRARAAGWDRASLQAAAGDQPIGRFVREPHGVDAPSPRLAQDSS